ncbi:MAG: hypothetical protein ACRC1J_11660, partial [Sandaracinobacteroides sp.]
EGFFTAFKAEVEGALSPEPEPATAPSAPQANVEVAEAQARGIPGWLWIGGLIALVLLALAVLL